MAGIPDGKKIETIVTEAELQFLNLVRLNGFSTEAEQFVTEMGESAREHWYSQILTLGTLLKRVSEMEWRKSSKTKITIEVETRESGILAETVKGRKLPSQIEKKHQKYTPDEKRLKNYIPLMEKCHELNITFEMLIGSVANSNPDMGTERIKTALEGLASKNLTKEKR